MANGGGDERRAEVVVRLRAEGQGEADRIAQELARARIETEEIRAAFLRCESTADQFRKALAANAANIKFLTDQLDGVVGPLDAQGAAAGRAAAATEQAGQRQVAAYREAAAAAVAAGDEIGAARARTAAVAEAAAERERQAQARADAAESAELLRAAERQEAMTARWESDQERRVAAGRRLLAAQEEYNEAERRRGALAAAVGDEEVAAAERSRRLAEEQAAATSEGARRQAEAYALLESRHDGVMRQIAASAEEAAAREKAAFAAIQAEHIARRAEHGPDAAADEAFARQAEQHARNLTKIADAADAAAARQTDAFIQSSAEIGRSLERINTAEAAAAAKSAAAGERIAAAQGAVAEAERRRMAVSEAASGSAERAADRQALLERVRVELGTESARRLAEQYALEASRHDQAMEAIAGSAEEAARREIEAFAQVQRAYQARRAARGPDAGDDEQLARDAANHARTMAQIAAGAETAAARKVAAFDAATDRFAAALDREVADHRAAMGAIDAQVRRLEQTQGDLGEQFRRGVSGVSREQEHLNDLLAEGVRWEGEASTAHAGHARAAAVDAVEIERAAGAETTFVATTDAATRATGRNAAAMDEDAKAWRRFVAATVDTQAQIDGSQAQFGRLRSQARLAGDGLEQARGASEKASYAILHVAHALQDAQYGFGAVLNNVPLVVQAFGGGPGLGGAVMIAGVAFELLKGHVGDVRVALGMAVDPAQAFARTSADLKAKLDALEAKWFKVGVDYTDIDQAQAALERLKVAEAAYEEGKKTKGQARVVEEAKKVVEVAGGTPALAALVMQRAAAQGQTFGKQEDVDRIAEIDAQIASEKRGMVGGDWLKRKALEFHVGVLQGEREGITRRLQKADEDFAKQEAGLFAAGDKGAIGRFKALAADRPAGMPAVVARMIGKLPATADEAFQVDMEKKIREAEKKASEDQDREDKARKAALVAKLNAQKSLGGALGGDVQEAISRGVVDPAALADQVRAGAEARIRATKFVPENMLRDVSRDLLKQVIEKQIGELVDEIDATNKDIVAVARAHAAAAADKAAKPVVEHHAAILAPRVREPLEKAIVQDTGEFATTAQIRARLTPILRADVAKMPDVPRDLIDKVAAKILDDALARVDAELIAQGGSLIHGPPAPAEAAAAPQVALQAVSPAPMAPAGAAPAPAEAPAEAPAPAPAPIVPAPPPPIPAAPAPVVNVAAPPQAAAPIVAVAAPQVNVAPPQPPPAPVVNVAPPAPPAPQPAPPPAPAGPPVKVDVIPPAPVQVEALAPAPVRVQALAPDPVKVQGEAAPVVIPVVPPGPVEVAVEPPAPVAVAAVAPPPVVVPVVAPDPVQVRGEATAVVVPVVPPKPVEVPVTPPAAVAVAVLAPAPVRVEGVAGDPVVVAAKAGPQVQVDGRPGPDVQVNAVAGPPARVEGEPGPPVRIEGEAGDPVQVEGVAGPRVQVDGVAGPKVPVEGRPGAPVQVEGKAGPRVQLDGEAGPKVEIQGRPGPKVEVDGKPGPPVAVEGVAGPKVRLDGRAGDPVPIAGRQAGPVDIAGRPGPKVEVEGKPGPKVEVQGMAGPKVQVDAKPGPQVEVEGRQGAPVEIEGQAGPPVEVPARAGPPVIVQGRPGPDVEIQGKPGPDVQIKVQPPAPVAIPPPRIVGGPPPAAAARAAPVAPPGPTVPAPKVKAAPRARAARGRARGRQAPPRPTPEALKNAAIARQVFVEKQAQVVTRAAGRERGVGRAQDVADRPAIASKLVERSGGYLSEEQAMSGAEQFQRLAGGGTHPELAQAQVAASMDRFIIQNLMVARETGQMNQEMAMALQGAVQDLALLQAQIGMVRGQVGMTRGQMGKSRQGQRPIIPTTVP